MPTALIFGGSGKVARHLTTKLTASSYAVHSIIRNPAQIPELRDLGAEPIIQDIETSSVEQLGAVIKHVRPDVVVFAAGAGYGSPERARTVDYEGAVKSFDATAAAGVKRYIIVSALDVRDLKKPVPEWYNEDDKAMSARIRGVIGAYLDAKFLADKDLVTNNGRRGLQYTIVRPGGLTTEQGKGKVAAGKVHISSMISRVDVAETVQRCIEDSSTIGLAFDVVGGDTPVAEAVKEAAAHKADTFEGYY